jgi:tetratricopeptide (TPR) repeat protein
VNVIEVAIDGDSHSGGYVVRVLRAPGGGEPTGAFTLDVDEILDQRSVIENIAIASSVPSRGLVGAAEQPFRRVGSQLFDALFIGEIATAYRTSLSVTQQRGEKLQVVLRLTEPELAALPWELLFDRTTQNYVCIRGPVIRHIPALTPAPLPLVPPLRILGVVASPHDLDPLDVAAERERLETALASPLSEGRIKLHWVAEASWAGVQGQLLAGQWHVLHFVGHGGYDARKDEGVIALVGTKGRADYIEATRLCDLLSLAQPTPRLVVLNCCSSGVNGKTDIFSGTATQLVKNGIGAVAAMQFAISDIGGISFARGFYESIATFHNVSDAMTSGRLAIRGTNSLEWATPVLWLSGDPDQRLFLPAPRGGDAEEKFIRAQTAISRQDWPTALREFTAVLDIDPQHNGAVDGLAASSQQYHLGQLYARAVMAMKDADWATAIRDLTAIINIDRDYGDASTQLAQAQRQAWQQLEQHYEYGRTAMSRAQWTAAVDELTTVATLDPRYRDIQELLAEAKYQQHLAQSYERGTAALNKGDYRTAVGEFTSLASTAENYRDVRQLLGVAENYLHLADRYAKAVAAFRSWKLPSATRGFTGVLLVNPHYRDAGAFRAKAKQRLRIVIALPSIALVVAGAVVLWPRSDPAPPSPPLPASTMVVPRALVDDDPKLYLVDSASGVVGDLVPTDYKPYEPTLTSDRSKIIYQHRLSESDTRVLRIVGVDGSADGDLFQAPPDNCKWMLRPAWNPKISGQLALACIQWDDVFSLRVVDLDGTVERTLTTGDWIDDVSFSPNGQAITYATGSPRDPGVYTVPTDGSKEPVRIARGRHPMWSPDGSRIVFTGTADVLNAGDPAHFVIDGDISLINPDGSGEIGLTSGSDRDDNPSWSPDSSTLVFLSNRDSSDSDRFAAWLIGADGSDLRPLLPGDVAAVDSQPAWASR